MADNESNTRSRSTTWQWRRVKIARAPEAPSKTAPKASSRPSASARDPREPLTITVRYRGGGEAWYELQARGRTIRRPGALAFHDVMQELYRER